MTIQIEITFANDQNQLTLPLTLSTPCSIAEAIQLSGILIQAPVIDLTQNKVGIFGKLRPLNTLVQPGDRIEIYRALSIDPKKNRRNRAKKQKTNLATR
jgi:putative ubiquitin-RnfH superfamily antitoxin RatB of RatAB toxin-antitoxin module